MLHGWGRVTYCIRRLVLTCVCILFVQLHGAQYCWSGTAVGSAWPALHAHAAQPRTADSSLVGCFPSTVLSPLLTVIRHSLFERHASLSVELIEYTAIIICLMELFQLRVSYWSGWTLCSNQSGVSEDSLREFSMMFKWVLFVPCCCECWNNFEWM